MIVWVYHRKNTAAGCGGPGRPPRWGGTACGRSASGAASAPSGRRCARLTCWPARTLTALGWYQKLALRAGAGSLVPITGFANAVVSAAIEFRPEGCVTGTGAKMFTIAGPVIVYGTLASAVYGLALWVSTLL